MNGRTPVVREERWLPASVLTPTNRGATRRIILFIKGDKVVYPQHGAALIERLVEREVLGKRTTYLQLRIPSGDLTIMVPVDSAEQVGLRGVVRKEDMDTVFDLLRGDEALLPLLWSQRYKANLAKLVSGDIYQGAEVIRDLSLREKRTGVSAAEKRMLAKARQFLISELTLAFDSTEENARAMLDDVLEGSN